MIQMTPHEALTMIVDWGLTKEQYINIRVNALQRNACIYPSYEDVKLAKVDCEPPNMVCSPESCVVPMQDVLHHQVGVYTMVENHQKCLISIFQFWHFFEHFLL